VVATVTAEAQFDAQRFRQVVGHYPSGVAVVTAASDGRPVGLAIASFCSLSLDPPLVLFCAAQASTSWPQIREVGKFCVNVLAADQQGVCEALARTGGDKFQSLSWTPAPSGSPILAGVLAWIDCDVETVHTVGDHQIVIGRVRTLNVERDGAPLLFFRSRYGSFSTPEVAAGRPYCPHPSHVSV